MKTTMKSLSEKVFFYAFAVLFIVISLEGMIGCEKKKEPIKVGFAGGLTGRLSDLGIGGKNVHSKELPFI